jgi:hypothetical protein
MGEAGGDRYLALETLRAKRRSQLGAQQLDGHLPVEREILGEVDRGHPTAAKLTLDRVSTLESGGHVGEPMRHRSRSEEECCKLPVSLRRRQPPRPEPLAAPAA